jgi:neutral ceramidase
MQSRRDFLKAGLVLAAAAGVLPVVSRGKSADPAVLKAGSGRADVVFDAGLFPFSGFAGQHDPLAVRAVLLDDGRRRLGIVVIDITSISQEMISAAKTMLTQVAGVTADHAIICAIHTFSAPHVFSPQQAPPGTDLAKTALALSAFEDALRRAVGSAVDSMQPARIGVAAGTTRVGVNRDVPTAHGWWLGADDAGYVDPFLGVLRVDSLDGKPLAVLMNVSVQASIMDGSQRTGGGALVSADLAGASARHVETHYGAQCVALFMVGAAGDQAPVVKANRVTVADDGKLGSIDLHEAGFALVDMLGERLGADVIRAVDTIAPQSGASLDIERTSVEVTALQYSPHNGPQGPVTHFSYQPGGKISVPVVLMRIGGMMLVGMQPELTANIGTLIRKRSPYALTMVATMVDGAAKYMPDASSYDRFTYEARSSPFARGSAETVVAAIAQALNQRKAATSKRE